MHKVLSGRSFQNKAVSSMLYTSLLSKQDTVGGRTLFSYSSVTSSSTSALSPQTVRYTTA
jgi:hypothetical protein